jgi:hypothetical protein
MDVESSGKDKVPSPLLLPLLLLPTLLLLPPPRSAMKFFWLRLPRLTGTDSWLVVITASAAATATADFSGRILFPCRSRSSSATVAAASAAASDGDPVRRWRLSTSPVARGGGDVGAFSHVVTSEPPPDGSDTCVAAPSLSQQTPWTLAAGAVGADAAAAAASEGAEGAGAAGSAGKMRISRCISTSNSSLRCPGRPTAVASGTTRSRLSGSSTDNTRMSDGAPTPPAGWTCSGGGVKGGSIGAD